MQEPLTKDIINDYILYFNEKHPKIIKVFAVFKCVNQKTVLCFALQDLRFIIIDKPATACYYIAVVSNTSYKSYRIVKEGLYWKT